MKLRDFLIIVCLVAVVALLHKSLNDNSQQSNLTQTQIEATPVLTGEPTPEIAHTPKHKPAPKAVNTDFRVKRVTSSVLVENVSGAEHAVIAGFVSSTPISGNAHHIFDDFRQVEIDGLRFAKTYDEKALLSILGKPTQTGTLETWEKRYHRWAWPNKRDLLLVESKDGTGLRVCEITGTKLLIAGSPVLNTGDSKDKAVKLLGTDLRHAWGRDTILSLIVAVENDRVRSISLGNAEWLPQISLPR